MPGRSRDAASRRPWDGLGVGEKITANKAQPSKPDPLGKGGSQIGKAAGGCLFWGCR